MKGQITSTMLFYVLKFGILVLVIFMLKGLTPYLITVHVDTQEIEFTLFVNQLITKSIALEKNGYPHIGIIDVSKIDLLDNIISYDKKMSAKISLTNMTGSMIKKGYFQKDFFDVWSVLLGKRGSGGTAKQIKEYYVLYLEENKQTPGKLTIEMVKPNG